MLDAESSNHQHFEELCALAALGEMSDEQFVEFREHIETCASCRVEYGDYVETLHNNLPLANPGHLSAELPRQLEGYRQRFLARAREQGFKFSSGVETQPFRWRRFADAQTLMPSYIRAFAILVLVLSGAVAFLGYKLHRIERLSVAQAADAATLAGQNTVIQQELHSYKARLASPTPTPQPPTPALVDYKAVLARSKLLEREVAEASSRISALEKEVASGANRESDLAQKLQQAQATLNQTTVELHALREHRSEDAGLMAAQEGRINELSTKLREQLDAIERDRKLLAADRDIRELMGARNLHIIDVFDVDGRGQTRRPFGRAFYTEGKSLIFYAFDLAPKRFSRTPHSFQAWGYREPASQSAQSLGILFVDDQTQNRWVLKFDDPDVLAQIDAVFVTVEPRGGSSKPTGQRVLYAYLKGQPNHP